MVRRGAALGFGQMSDWKRGPQAPVQMLASQMQWVVQMLPARCLHDGLPRLPDERKQAKDHDAGQSDDNSHGSPRQQSC